MKSSKARDRGAGRMKPPGDTPTNLFVKADTLWDEIDRRLTLMEMFGEAKGRLDGWEKAMRTALFTVLTARRLVRMFNPTCETSGRQHGPAQSYDCLSYQ